MSTAAGGGWQPMSPDQVLRAPLKESGLGRRGYRPEDVDRMRAEVAAELDRWGRAYADAQNEIRRLRGYFREHGIDPGATERTGRHDAVSAEAVAIVARAQAYADRLVADAQVQARHVQADARSQAEAIVSQARRQADQAGQAYRARAGELYSADREETERLTAWARSILATMQAVQHQIGATAEAFSLELNKLEQSSPGMPAGAAQAHARPSAAAADSSPFD